MRSRLGRVCTKQEEAKDRKLKREEENYSNTKQKKTSTEVRVRHRPNLERVIKMQREELGISNDDDDKIG